MYEMILIPPRMAFYRETDIDWADSDLIFDAFFFLDILISFFTAVYDN
jgi:hypothetical protein